MLLRNLLIALGALSLIAGITLAVLWIRQSETPIAVLPAAKEVARPATLTASKPITAGTLLRLEDMRWREIDAQAIRPGMLLRGQVSEAEFVGAIARRDFIVDEALVAGDLVKPSERQFLAASLKPDMRAVSVAVDELQSASGLIRPGDRVDIILTQSFGEGAAIADKSSVGETVLRDVRVIAVDQALRPSTTPATPVTEPRLPRTVTFEVTERQAETLFVASQLGRLQLSLRPLEGSTNTTTGRATSPTWGTDVSPALQRQVDRPVRLPSPVESAVRRPPVRQQ